MTSRDETWLRWPSAALAVVVNGWLLHHLWDRVATRPITSPDAGWHLAAGRVITETGGVPRIDPFTFTAGAADWINLNWLAQSILYQLYLLGGPLAVTTLATALLALAAWAVLQTLRVRRVDPLPGLLVFAAVVFALLYNQGIRPRLWTYALLAVFAWILTVPDPSEAADDASDEAPSALALDLGRAATLLGLLWVWNHLHGGFVYGYALLGMDALAALVVSVRGGHGWFPQRTTRLGVVIVLGLAAFAGHPHGFASLPYVASYKQALGSQLTTILELLPLDFTKPHGRFAELYPGEPRPRALALAAAAAVARRPDRAPVPAPRPDRPPRAVPAGAADRAHDGGALDRRPARAARALAARPGRRHGAARPELARPAPRAAPRHRGLVRLARPGLPAARRPG